MQARRGLDRLRSPPVEGIPARQYSRAHISNRTRHWRRTQRLKVVRHLLQIRVGEVFEEIVHRRVAAPPISERDQLVHQITGRLAGEARKIVVSLSPRPAGRGKPHKRADAPRSCRGHVASAGRAQPRQDRALLSQMRSRRVASQRPKRARGSDLFSLATFPFARCQLHVSLYHSRNRTATGNSKLDRRDAYGIGFRRLGRTQWCSAGQQPFEARMTASGQGRPASFASTLKVQRSVVGSGSGRPNSRGQCRSWVKVRRFDRALANGR